MIQRIQTIYLAVAIITMGLTLVFPFGEYQIETGNFTFNASGVDTSKTGGFSVFPVMYFIFSSILLAFFSIISFKSRKRQLQLNMLNYLLIVIVLVFIFVGFNQIEKKFHVNPDQITYGIGMFLPIVALVCIFLANRAIKSDEKLIKSMDRIR